MLSNIFRKTAAVSATFLLIGMNTAYAKDYLVDRTIAIAGDEAILFSDLNSEIIKYKNLVKASNKELPSDEVIRKNVLERLITKRLILQMAAKNNIVISDTDLDRAIKQIADNNGMTPEQMMSKYRSTGLTDLAIRNTIRDDIIIDEVKHSQVRSRIHVSDQEVTHLAQVLKKQSAHMLTYHLAVINILVPVTPSPAASDAANRKINMVLKELKAGMPFAKAAQKYSESSNAIDGGDLGKLTINEIPEYVAQAVSRAQAGDVIGPMKTERGLSLIKVYEIAKMTPQPLEQVKVRHILLTTNIIFDDEAAEKRLNNIRNGIINGDYKFEDEARKYSEDFGSAYNGGLIDWSNPDIFDPRFREALKNLEPGEISEPFKSSFGWHIVEVIDRKVDKDSIEAYKIKAREILSNRSIMEESEKWERELRDSAYIKIFDN